MTSQSEKFQGLSFSQKRLLIVDTFNFFHRAYHALPVSLTTPDGVPVNAVYGVASMLLNLFELVKPTFVVAALESEEKTQRKIQYADYKAQRKPLEETLKSQIPSLLEILEAFGICALSSPGYEGDDVIGSLVFQNQGKMEIIIASNDRDLWQLVTEGVLVLSPKNNGKLADWVGTKEVLAQYGFPPPKIVDYKAITGDPSDNIPGINGIGKVTATKLIVKYGSLDNIYNKIDDVKADFGESVRQKLVDGKERAYLSRDLAEIKKDLSLEFSPDACVFGGLPIEKLTQVLEKYAFYSLIRRLEGKTPKVKENKDTNQLKLF